MTYYSCEFTCLNCGQVYVIGSRRHPRSTAFPYRRACSDKCEQEMDARFRAKWEAERALNQDS